MHKKIYAFIIFFVIGVVVFFGYLYMKNSDVSRLSDNGFKNVMYTSYANAQGQEWTIPEGKYEFDVTSGEIYPKFISGVIDPLDVKVGDTQKMRVSIHGDLPIERVVAEIETDTATKIVELLQTNISSISLYEPIKKDYIVDKKGFLVKNAQKEGGIMISSLIRNVEAESQLMRYDFEGEWIVENTHTKTYRTKFVAYDVSERSNSITLAWSDPVCLFGSGSTGDLVSSCAISSGIEGFDGGMYSVGSGASITFTGPGKLIYNGGASGINVGSGSIIGLNVSGASIEQGFIYLIDSDNDGFASNVQPYATSSASWSGHKRLKDILGAKVTNSQFPATSGLDCLDTSPDVRPNQTQYFSTPANEAPWWDYNCDGIITDDLFPSSNGVFAMDEVAVCEEYQEGVSIHICNSTTGGECVYANTAPWQDYPNMCWREDTPIYYENIAPCGSSNDSFYIEEWYAPDNAFRPSAPQTRTRSCK